VASSALPTALASCSTASWLQALPQPSAGLRKAAASLAAGTLALQRKSLARLQQAGDSGSALQLEQLLVSACCLSALASLAASSRGASAQQQQEQQQQKRQAAAGGAVAEALLGEQHCQNLLASISGHLSGVHSLAQQPGSAGWTPQLLQLAVPAAALLQQLCHLLPAATAAAGALSAASPPLPQQLLELHLQLLCQLVPPSTLVLLPLWHADISWGVLAGPQVDQHAGCSQRLLLGLLLSLQSLLRACSEEQLQALHSDLLGLLGQQELLDGPGACALAQALLVALETTPGRPLLRELRHVPCWCAS
jgi:hypothetical protein